MLDQEAMRSASYKIVGQRLDHYELRGVLDFGSMACVYRAYDEERGHDVALKVLNRYFGDARAVSRYVRETTIMEGFHHAHIVPVYGSGEVDNHYLYMAMKLITGKNLRDRFQARRKLMLPIEVCQLGEQMCLALDYAHQRKVIHCDVKPANILIEPMQADHFLLTDFGIARLLDGARITQKGEIVGDPRYMAPEKYQAGIADPATDIYSLACMLYEMLTGRPPFLGTATEIWQQHVHTLPRLATQVNPAVPKRLALALDQALVKDPRKRYGSAITFALQLKDSLA